MFLVGFPVELNNRVPATQARFPQLRVIERFCVKVFTNYLLSVLLERQYRHFRFSTFPFFCRNSWREGLTRGLAQGCSAKKRGVGTAFPGT